jgi:outer membrane receptor protein involved in Fe transport
MKIKYKTILIIPILFFQLFCISQNTGTLEGKVINEEDGLGIPSVNIIIKETLLGSATGLHGGFTINNIPKGKYIVLISFLGFETVEKSVTIGSSEITRIEINMKPSSLRLSSVQIQAHRSFSAASSKSIRQFDMKTRPARSSQDLLMLAPGLIIAQHAGGGKAEQIFMRGFDADHGTDVAISVDGLPVNMVTHGHGQGYADLHFLIPEIVNSVDVYKGPYFSKFGDFATAGAVSFTTVDHPENNLVKIEGGMYNTGELTTVLKIPTSGVHQSAYFAGQFYSTDGPFESPQGFNRYNVFGKFHSHLSEKSELAVSMGSFSSAWDASGQIPTRAVNEGIITRFGAIDDMEGGTTSRTNFSVKYNYGAGTNSEFSLQAYSSWYNFKLFSNFTYYLIDSINGDMIEQTDYRSITGINSKYTVRSKIGGFHTKTTVGGGLRADNINVELWKSPDRMREAVLRNDYVSQRNLFFWADEVFYFTTKWRLQLGLRADYFTFDMDDKLDNNIDTIFNLPHASTYAQKVMVNPKLNLVYSPSNSFELFFNCGSGFHSNDARDVIISQRISEMQHSLKNKGYSKPEIDSALLANNFNPANGDIKVLPRAIGTEIGTKINIGKNAILGLSVWHLIMQEELVFVGDEGNTEISGKTQRIGIDFEARVQIINWLWADLNVNLSEGRYVDEPEGSNYIPLAPNFTTTGGITAIHPAGFEGSLRFRHVGTRPANETNTVEALGYTVINARIGYKLGKTTIFGDVENLTNTDWNEAQFDTESRLKNESESVSEINFTPGNPIKFKLGLIVHF